MLIKQLPFQLLVTIVFAALCAPFLPQAFLDVGYTAGVLFKDLLMIFIPFVVWGYLMSALVAFDKKSLLLAVGLVFLTTISSLLTAITAYGFSLATFSQFHFAESIAQNGPKLGEQGIKALWLLPFHSPLTPSVAIMLALALGFLSIFAEINPLKNFAITLRDHSTRILKAYFLPFLPLYVFAVLIKIQSQGSLSFFLTQYSKVFFVLYTTLFVLLTGFLFLISQYSIKKVGHTLKTLFKPAMTAFTTMSGVAAMPFLVASITKHTKNKPYAEFTVPLATNIHTFGDGFIITVTALSLLYMTHAPLPSAGNGLTFIACYCLARFFNACVPGGGILVMAPFIEHYLGLSPELIGLLTTLYVLQDPLISMINTVGNGILCILIYPLFKKKLKVHVQKKEGNHAYQRSVSRT